MADFFVDLELINGPCGAAYEELISEEELREEWRERRELLIAEEEARSPGSRPWAFWAFDVQDNNPTEEVTDG